MRTALVLFLILTGHFALASQSQDWLRSLDNAIDARDRLNDENQLGQFSIYDFSNLLTPKSDFLGYIGTDYRRLFIRFISVKRDSTRKNTYLVIGTSQIGQHMNDFSGVVVIDQVRKFVNLHYGVDDEFKDAGIQAEGLITGQFAFTESHQQAYSGSFEGVMTAYWLIDRDGNFLRDEIEASYSDAYTNNQYVGTWANAKFAKPEVANWGEFRIPFSGDLDRGAAEFSASPKYWDYGWEAFREH